jgi:hypothetical protein
MGVNFEYRVEGAKAERENRRLTARTGTGQEEDTSKLEV